MDVGDYASHHEMNEIRYRILELQHKRKRAEENLTDELRTYCVDCGNEIPPERLKAVPWTQRCTACQEAEDEKR